MSIQTANLPERVMKDPFSFRRFTVKEYHLMIDAGIFTPNDRVELLEGWIVNTMPQSPPYCSSISRILRRIGRFLSDDWTIHVHGSITLRESEPEPDIILARGEEGTYDQRHPNPMDVGVLMEVGDSTLLEDRCYKGELYAKEKVPEFWLINLVDRIIEVYTKPRKGKYQKKIEYNEKESVPLILDGVKIADIPVSELMAKS